MPPRESPKKQWVFTINNYSDEELSSLKQRLQEHSQYAIIGQEQASTGTEHLQGFVSFKKKVRFSGAKQIIGDRAYIAPSRASAAANQAYCSKDGQFWEHGVPPRPARASDPDSRPLHELAQSFLECLETGKSLTDLLKDQPFHMLSHASTWLKSYHQIKQHEVKQRGPVLCIWLYGATGTGKSTFAHDLWPNAYIKDPSTLWWDGYVQQPEVIVDDFGFSYPPVINLLNWFSPFKCRVQIKGGYTSLAASKFIVTSNFHPDSLFPSQLDAVKRRFSIFNIEQGLEPVKQLIAEYEVLIESTPASPQPTVSSRRSSILSSCSIMHTPSTSNDDGSSLSDGPMTNCTLNTPSIDWETESDSTIKRRRVR